MQNFRSYITILSVFLMISFSGGSLYGQEIVIDKDKSNLWIEGRSNVNSFSCDANQYTVDSERLTSTIETEYREADKLKVEISILVEGFDCGRSRMNRDLYDALKADQHDSIHFEYQSSENVEYEEETGLYKITVNGVLTVAGQSNTIQLTVYGSLLDDGTIRAKGEKEIAMSDYKIDPPSAMLGLVKVQDNLSVHFDLTVEIIE